MSFKRRLRNACLFMLGALLVLFGLTATTAYAQGYLQPTQFIAAMYLAVALFALFAYLVINWRN